MKVLQVIDTLNVGGAERMTVFLANLLKKNNVDVTVFILLEAGRLRPTLTKDIPVIYLERDHRFNLKKLKQTAKIIENFDIIHVHLKHNFRYIALASKCFGIKRSRLIFHDHSHYYSISKFSQRQLKDSLFKSILKPKYFIGVSQENCQWARSSLQVADEHIFLLENTIAKVVDCPKSFVKSGLVMVSNISRVKHIEFAIQLAHTMKENLTIYGQVRDSTYFKELNDLIQSLDYADHIMFKHYCYEIQQELPNYKLAIHTSLKETGPLVLLEYLAQDLPFIAFATGQVYMTLKDKLPQCFVSKFDIATWSERIVLLESSAPEQFSTIYTTYFSSEKYISKCLKIYQKVLSS